MIVFFHGKNLTLARIQVYEVSLKLTIDRHPPPDLRLKCFSALHCPNVTQFALHCKIVACRVFLDIHSRTGGFVRYVDLLSEKELSVPDCVLNFPQDDACTIALALSCALVNVDLDICTRVYNPAIISDPLI